jgi:GTP cyclohydrolase IA
VQERLTAAIADLLEERLGPKGVGVVLEAEHLCMSLRGVEATGARTITSSLRGMIRHDRATREEFFALARGAA